MGGVSSHYSGLQPFWSKDVKYFFIGPPKWRTIFLLFYLAKYINCIITYKPDIILLNPSMAKKAIFRDSLYLKIGKLLKCKIAIMFHGFHIESIKGKETQIAKLLNSCEIIFVLANKFKDVLVSWGVKTPIVTTTTQVNDKMIEHFNINSRKGEIKNILYLARVTKAKGIFVALDIFKKLSEKYPQLNYFIVGNGDDLDNAIVYANKLNIPQIQFTGGLKGKDVVEAYKNADLYLFTSYHEGMPTSVLEAMAFGLPIITRPVGGLVDFFEEEKMGYLINSDKAQDFIKAFDILIKDKETVSRISTHNHKYATERFLASKVAPKMEQYLNECLTKINE